MLLGQTPCRVARGWILEHTNLRVTLGPCHLLTTHIYCSVPQFPHLQKGDYNNSNLREILYIKWHIVIAQKHEQ